MIFEFNSRGGYHDFVERNPKKNDNVVSRCTEKLFAKNIENN